jgi:hypothetical protein
VTAGDLLDGRDHRRPHQVQERHARVDDEHRSAVGDQLALERRLHPGEHDEHAVAGEDGAHGVGAPAGMADVETSDLIGDGGLLDAVGARGGGLGDDINLPARRRPA